MDLRSYISQVERKYRFRLKTVVDLDDEAMSKIEKTLVKYLPASVSSPKKTMFQAQPLDFASIKNAEVYMVDIELLLPASAYVLQQEVRLALGLPESFIVVRSENEQMEVETARLNALHDISMEQKDKDLKAVGTLEVEDYAEFDEKPGSNYYGNDYNSRLLSTLKKIEAERASKIKDPKNPLFSFLSMPKPETAADFNANIADAPKVGGGSEGLTDHGDLSRDGNLDDSNKVVKRVFQDIDGNRVVITRMTNSVRKGRS